MKQTKNKVVINGRDILYNKEILKNRREMISSLLKTEVEKQKSTKT